MIQDPVFWATLGLAPIAYWLTAPRWRRPVLAVISLGVILYYDATSLAIIVALSLLTFFSLPAISSGSRRSLPLLLVNIAALAGPLITLKAVAAVLLNPSIAVDNAGDVIVPLGMSYYVFRMLHVVIDAYRREKFDTPAETYFCYVFLFTIFPAGPIQRLDLFEENAVDTFDKRLVLDGLTRIAFGLVKQTAIIDAIFAGRDALTGGVEASVDPLLGASVGVAWVVVIAAYLTSYMNLSAYTDIAIGASRLFGFQIMENFRFPVAATSIVEFWRSWHLTLSGWCQTYIYSIVLGATRNPYLAIVLSFQAIALWHVFSLNRIAWGLMHAGGVIAASLYKRHWKSGPQAPAGLGRIAFTWLVTQLFVSASWVFVIGEEGNDILSSLRLLLYLLTGGLV